MLGSTVCLDRPLRKPTRQVLPVRANLSARREKGGRSTRRRATDGPRWVTGRAIRAGRSEPGPTGEHAAAYDQTGRGAPVPSRLPDPRAHSMASCATRRAQPIGQTRSASDEATLGSLDAADAHTGATSCSQPSSAPRQPPARERPSHNPAMTRPGHRRTAPADHPRHERAGRSVTQLLPANRISAGTVQWRHHQPRAAPARNRSALEGAGGGRAGDLE